MNPQAFKTPIAEAHRKWLGHQLGIIRAAYGDIDLFNDSLGIEIKTRYAGYPKNFTIHEYQYKHYPALHSGKTLYWAFLVYTMEGNPARIGHEEVGTRVDRREAWFLEWDFVRGFPVSRPKTGPYIYVNKKSFEGREFVEHEVAGGRLYFPPDASLLEKCLEVPF